MINIHNYLDCGIMQDENSLWNQESFLTFTNNIEKTENSDFVSLQHGENFIYSFVENIFFYDFSVIYLDFINYFFQNSYNLFNLMLWYKIITNNNYNLFLSVILDQFYYLKSVIVPAYSDFYKYAISSSEFSTIWNFHPEYLFIFKNSISVVDNFLSNMYLSIYLLDYSESNIFAVLVFFQFIVLYFIFIVFTVLFFVYFINSNFGNNIIDHDYLIFNVTIEAEEEIGSIDDMLLSLVILIYIFFWFFWIYSWFFSTSISNFSLSIFLFPLLYFIIMFIPTSLLYDFGLNFLTYLGGVGKSVVLVIELLFDYIAVAIFYLRLMVQNVRLIFMLFTYIELHELVVLFTFSGGLVILNEIFYYFWNLIKSSFDNNNWVVIKQTFAQILNWLYELFHTFFMVIFQFIAFFAMIFWLFLFLYTMFVSEPQESFFLNKRNLKRNLFKNLNNFNNLTSLLNKNKYPLIKNRI